MEIYFYCSYEHSKTGFFHTQLVNGELVPVAGGHEGLPEAVSTFFSYDQFQVLWRELSAPVDKPWKKPEPYAEVFGLREITGKFADGRNGTVNMAFYAPVEETHKLRRVALAVLGDYAGFCEQLLACMQIGGTCGYQLEGQALESWINECAEKSRLHLLAEADDPALKCLPWLQQTPQPARVERELLKFAVCTSDWKTIAETLGDKVNWYLKPRCAITRTEFQKYFVERPPLWELLEGV